MKRQHVTGNRMRIFIFAAFIIGLMISPLSVQAYVLTGTIQDHPEGTLFSFGDGTNNIVLTWSTRQESGGDGWFYGSSSYSDNADFYIYKGLTDPTTITNAATFSYSTGSDWAEQGDTVFFRSATGYFGALVIDSIYPNSTPHTTPYTFLNGTWYFQTDQSGDFTTNPVPIPGAMLLFAPGLAGLAVLRRRFKK